MSTATLSKPTPMMQQYFKIKRQYKEYLLLYRMGDFYELFFEDAIKASICLGITLTKRGNHNGDPIPMCGVPVQSCDSYLPKLINSGYNVALCEQMEDPAQAKLRGAKSVVKRAVTRIYTPGTLTEDKLLDPKGANYLAALSKDKKEQYAIAYTDISTGIFRSLKTTAKDLINQLSNISPKELLINQDEIFTDQILQGFKELNCQISRQSNVSFDLTQAPNRIKNYYNLYDEDLIKKFSDPELSAIGAIICYIERTQLENQPKLCPPRQVIQENQLYIDCATARNLEIFTNQEGGKKGSLLSYLDHTSSAIGSRELEDRLHHPLQNNIQINERLDSVEFFIKNQPLMKEIEQSLKQILDPSRALSRLLSNRGNPRDLSAILSLFKQAQNIANILKNSKLNLTKELDEIAKTLNNTPNNLMNELDRALKDDLPVQKSDGNFIKPNFSPELDQSNYIAHQNKEIILQLQEEFTNLTQIKNLRIKRNNILGLFVEINPKDKEKIAQFPQFYHRQSLSSAMRFSSAQLNELENKINNALSRALEIELEIFANFVQQIAKISDLIRQLSQNIANLDVAISNSIIAISRDFCRPVVDNSLAFEIIDGRHPIVEMALTQTASQSFIANDCNLSPYESDWGKFWLITGPNMGGKSTFLRQNALITLMAQIGSYVPAASAHIGVVDRIFSRVGASDNLRKGLSTFMVEMTETATILNNATAKSLVILDEIGRGTATYDGLAIAQAVALYIHNKIKCRTLFATHFHELTSLDQTLERFYNHTIKVLDWDGKIVFLHEIVDGRADRSYGIHVAELSGIPEPVIKQARAILYEINQNAQQINLPQADCAQEPSNLEQNFTKDPIDPKLNILQEKLKNLEINNLTPLQALNELQELKKLIN